eukprot:gene10144-13646_t
MGVTSSSNSPNSTPLEGEHFSVIIKSAGVGGKKVSGKSSALVPIHSRAAIIKSLSYAILWESFLDSSYETFALTTSETTLLLKESLIRSDIAACSNGNKRQLSESDVNVLVKNYVDLVTELSEKDTNKTFDFMAICSSVLLLSATPVEQLADQLFEWIVLGEDEHPDEFSFDQFLVALSSFERGLSNAIGKPASSEQYVRMVSTQWIALADPKHKGSADINTRINQASFFDFCTNRQHIVRRLLEILATAQVVNDNNIELHEVVVTIDEEICEPTGGDEWLANPAWKKTAERMVPKDIKPPNTKPSSNLSLEWVYGYRGFDCRNNVRYVGSNDNQVLFTAAGVSVVQSSSNQPDHRSQSFFYEHSDDIISIASHTFGNDTLVATGEIGKHGLIYLYSWNQSQFQSKISMQGFHKKGVVQLAFSRNAKMLFTVGKEYAVAIYNTDCDPSKPNPNLGKMICSSQGPKDSIMHATCFGNGESPIVSGDESVEFVSCGEKHVIVWKIERMTLKQIDIKLGSNKNKTYMSVTRLLCDQKIKVAALSTSDGLLMFLSGDTVTPYKSNATKPIHEGKSINALWSNPVGDTMVSGGKDGSVIVWLVKPNSNPPFVELDRLSDFKVFSPVLTQQLSTQSGSITSMFGIAGASAQAAFVRSVCLSSDGTKVLVGTQNCEIIEFEMTGSDKSFKSKHSLNRSDLKSSSIIGGHFKDELWGLSIRPVTEQNKHIVQFCTVGDDAFLRIWNLTTHEQILAVALNGIARACAYSPDGDYIAVGFGGSLGKGKNKEDGLVKVFRVEYANSDKPQSLTQVVEIKEAKAWISVVKYSPDGTTLAVGSRDNSIYLYSVMQQYKRKAKFSKHNSGINQLDFTADGRYIQSCCSAYEILFSDSSTGTQITDGASLLTNAEWHTWTLTLGWSVIGIWSGSMDGSDINAVDRSPSGKLLATSDDFGKVSVFRYPAIQEGGAQYNQYPGHSSHVTCVRWVCCKPLPKIIPGAPAPPPPTDDYLISTGGSDNCIFQWKNSGPEVLTKGSKAVNSKSFSEESNGGNDDFDVPSGGDEFMAVKPWLGAIVAPTAWSASDESKKHPFFAALGELSNQHNLLQQSLQKRLTLKGGDSSEKMHSFYSDAIRATELTALKASESGVIDASAPDLDELELSWVYGYRGFDIRNNVEFVASRMDNALDTKARFVVYCAAALAVVYNPLMHSQKYFRGHNDDVLSLAVYRPTSIDGTGIEHDKNIAVLVATGQQGLGKTFVWEVPSLKTLSTLQTKQKNVNMLCFSCDGKLLVTVAEDKTVAISDWRSQTVLNNTSGEPAPTHHLTVGTNLSANFDFYSCGDKHIRYWSLSGRVAASTKVSLGAGTGKSFSIQQFLCIVYVNELALVGCEDGSIYIINDNNGKKAVVASFPHKQTKIANDNLSNETNQSKEEPIVAAAPPAAKGAKPTGGKNAPAKAPANKSGKTAASSSKASEGSGNKAVKDPSVTAMHYNNRRNILLTGAKDGTIVIWKTENLSSTSPSGLNAKHVLCSFSVDSLGVDGISAKQIQSLSLLDYNDNQSVFSDEESLIILVSTRGCDILEVECPIGGKAQLFQPGEHVSKCSGIINRSHCNDELWGAATHPFLPECCSVGDDKTLRVYNLLSHKLKQIVPLGNLSRACAYSPDGLLLAVGFGGRVGKGNEAGGGMVRIYSSGSGESSKAIVKLAESRDAKQWISDVKFSGVAINGGSYTLAIGAHDCKIYIYDVKYENHEVGSATLKLRATFSKHNSVINHLDFSSDGRFLQSNCSAYELLFSDATTGKQITSASEVKDVKWGTWTCTLGWPVQGIWASGMDGSDINATARSHSGHLIVTSDDFGKVNMFRYPCVKTGAANLAYSGHSSHVAKVLWSVADEFVLSCGGNDKCLMQWTHNMVDVTGGAAQMSSTSSSNTVSSTHQDDHEFGVKGNSMESDDGFDAPGGGDEAGAVKPWLGAIRAPSNPPPINPAAPSARLELQWIHGYTSASAGANNAKISSNLYYSVDGKVVYPAAAMGILLSATRGQKEDDHNMSANEDVTPGTINKEQFKQQYYRGHDDDILCLTVSQERRYVATGQTASKATKGKGGVIVWDAIQCRILSRLDACHQRGVSSLAFSPGEDMLLSVGMDDNNTHILWKDTGGGWSRIAQLASSKGDKAPVLFSKWVSPNNIMVSSSEYHFVTGGSAGINFWKLEGATLTKKAGRFGKKSKNCPLLCAANVQGKDKWRLVVGTSAGDLYFYDEREANIAVEGAHGTSPVLCLAEGSSEGLFIVSGGRDRSVRIWNQSLQPISAFDLSPYSCVDATVASVDVKPFIQ